MPQKVLKEDTHLDLDNSDEKYFNEWWDN